MSRRKAPRWRIASIAALLGLISSGITVAALAEDRAGSARAPGTADLSSQPASMPSAPGASTGLPWLQQAAAACQDTSFRGVQVVMSWGPGGTTTSVVDVWHQPGQATVVQAASNASSSTAADPPSGSAGYLDPDGILGVSPPLLDLLQANYQVVYAGRGTMAGREAVEVEVLHPGGGLAARFWLDTATKLPLRREIFGNGARLVSVDAFTSLTVGRRGLGSSPTMAATPWTTELDAARLTSLRTSGWPLPAHLPVNLKLFAATMTSTNSGRVVGLSYSDGLVVVSLFVQRGELAGAMPGWREVSLAGRTVYAADPAGESTLSWSAGGYVYTLIANAPPETVRQVVVTLPGNSTPGFWQRIGHGLRRLASWANPLSH